MESTHSIHSQSLLSHSEHSCTFIGFWASVPVSEIVCGYWVRQWTSERASEQASEIVSEWARKSVSKRASERANHMKFYKNTKPKKWVCIGATNLVIGWAVLSEWMSAILFLAEQCSVSTIMRLDEHTWAIGWAYLSDWISVPERLDGHTWAIG